MTIDVEGNEKEIVKTKWDNGIQKEILECSEDEKKKVRRDYERMKKNRSLFP